MSQQEWEIERLEGKLASAANVNESIKSKLINLETKLTCLIQKLESGSMHSSISAGNQTTLEWQNTTFDKIKTLELAMINCAKEKVKSQDKRIESLKNDLVFQNERHRTCHCEYNTLVESLLCQMKEFVQYQEYIRRQMRLLAVGNDGDLYQKRTQLSKIQSQLIAASDGLCWKAAGLSPMKQRLRFEDGV